MPDKLRLILHAPTPGALRRARSNARNFRAAEPDGEVRIIANAAAAAEALAHPDPAADRHLVLCRNSLTAQQIDAPAGIEVTPAAVVLIARLQAEGWAYMRA